MPVGIAHVEMIGMLVAVAAGAVLEAIREAQGSPATSQARTISSNAPQTT